MSQARLAVLFNEWMKRYINNPEGFRREFQDVQQFMEQTVGGAVPTYGEEAAAYLAKLNAEVPA